MDIVSWKINLHSIITSVTRVQWVGIRDSKFNEQNEHIQRTLDTPMKHQRQYAEIRS